MKESKILLFNNGEAYLEKPVTLIVDGRSNLTPRAYYLLNILSKKLMKRLLQTKKANDNIVDSLSSLKSLRTTTITVEEYMNETGLADYYIARERLATSGAELHSFLMSFQSDQFDQFDIFKENEDDVEWKVTFIQNLTGSGQIYEDNGQLDLEFYPDLISYMIKKYRDEKYKDLKAKDFTADMLLSDLMELGLSYIRDYGFEVNSDFNDKPEAMIDFIRSHYCLGPAPIMT